MKTKFFDPLCLPPSVSNRFISHRFTRQALPLLIILFLVGRWFVFSCFLCFWLCGANIFIRSRLIFSRSLIKKLPLFRQPGHTGKNCQAVIPRGDPQGAVLTHLLDCLIIQKIVPKF